MQSRCSQNCQCVIYYSSTSSEVGIAAAFLDFLTSCQRESSWQNIYGTTIEGFCMKDGYQLLPPVWWRGWRQHQKETSCTQCFTNDCPCCYLLGWRRGDHEKAWHDNDRTWEIMRNSPGSGLLCLCLMAAGVQGCKDRGGLQVGWASYCLKLASQLRGTHMTISDLERDENMSSPGPSTPISSYKDRDQRGLAWILGTLVATVGIKRKASRPTPRQSLLEREG